MINIIFILFTIGVFWCGFKCGNKFAAIGAMFDSLVKKVSGSKPAE